MRFIKTDHSHLSAKLALRSDNLPDKKEINVLDAYTSDGVLWRELKKSNPDKTFRIARLDNSRRKAGFYVVTSNEQFLQAADLNVYDVIDLDAYGVPIKQLKILFAARITSPITVFVTFNSVVLGVIPKEMLLLLGFTKAMLDTTVPILCSADKEEKLFGYLYLKGVRQVKKVSFIEGVGYHCYLTFKLGDN